MNLQEMIDMYDKHASEINKTGFLKKDDWEAICRVIVKFNLKNIMEFGSGTSSRLFHDCGIKCISYEQDQNFVNIVSKQCPNNKIVKWDGVSVRKEDYDLVFIDGPWCKPKTVYRNREQAFKLTLDLKPKFVAMHDMHFKDERRHRNQFFGSWIQVDQSELTHIVRNPKYADNQRKA